MTGARNWALLILMAVACGPAANRTDARAVALLASLRPYTLRIADDGKFAPCALSDGDRSSAIAVRCAPTSLTVDELDRIGRFAVSSNRLVARGNTDALRAIVRIEMAFGIDAGNVDATIARIEEIGARTADSVETASLLAIVYAARAQINDDPLDLHRALDAAARAAALRPNSPAASFNRAILLEAAHLTRAATAAWQQYLDLDSRSAWAREAKTRLAALHAEVQHAHQPIGERAIDAALMAWAQAVAARDAVAARQVLAQAVAAADSLDRLTGDRSAVLSVAEIARASPGETGRLANGLVDRERGRTLFEQGSFAAARAPLESAIERIGPSRPALRSWAEMLLAAIDMYQGRAAQAERTYRLTAAGAFASGNATVAARASWGLGLLYGRQGRTAEALASYADAADTYDRQSDGENLGAMRFLVGELHGLTGQRRTAMASIHGGLLDLRAYPSSPYRHNSLLYLLTVLSNAGLHAAAVEVAAEDVAVAGRTGRVKDLPEALAWMARAEIDASRTASAARHLAEAGALVENLEDPVMRERLAIDIAQSQALLLLEAGRPSSAIPLLSEAIGYFERQRAFALIPPLIARRARAHLELADTLSAQNDLAWALELAEREAGFAPTAEARHAVIEAAMPVYDAMIGLLATEDRPLDALSWLERSRGMAPSGTPPDPDPDVVILEYAVLADRTLLWILTSDSIAMHAIPRTRSDLVAEADRFINLINGVGDTTAMHIQARRLHDMLVAPAIEAIGKRSRLIIVADGPLHRIPFAALQDSKGASLVRSFAIAHAPAAMQALRTSPARSTAFTAPLFVGDPQFDRDAFPDLLPLRAATTEADAFARFYPGLERLSGAEATRTAVSDRIEGRDLFHFAGHARFRPDRPELSHLVLARDGDAEDDALYARDISRLDLSSLILAVLSACRTQSAADTRTGGFNGLSRAFLEAGANGVLGSLWEIDDRTAVTFMTHFYAALNKGEAAPDALRHAQLTLLDSADAELRDPALWAAFVYEGH